MLCPLCAAALPAGDSQCPGCGADLTEYLNALYQPDLLFNEALRLLKRERWSEAGDLLCRAHSLRPEDAGILDLWVRAEYSSGNKKRALELMTDLAELEDTPARARQLELLVEEYDRDQADAGLVVKRELRAQNDRLQSLLDRLEDRLSALDGTGPSDPPSSSLSAGDPERAPASQAGPPAEGPDPSSFFKGDFSDFSRFSDMFPPKDPS